MKPRAWLEPITSKVAFSILNMPDGKWHWVIRLWKDGPDKPFEMWSAKRSLDTAAAAFAEALAEQLRLAARD